MDAFYAALEQARHPELRNKPVIIGTGNRAVVSAANYQARAYGINSAMPVARARARCPQGVFLPVDMPYYRQQSHTILQELFTTITDQIEQVSVDECYMNVQSALLRWKSPITIATWIRQEVAERFHITCSIGIASNKLIAKMASTNAKPNGMLLIPCARNRDFMKLMPLQAIPGIGPHLAKTFAQWGILSVEDALNYDEKTLTRICRSAQIGHTLYLQLRGIDDRPVVPHTPEKSIGLERTFQQDTTNDHDVTHLLHYCCEEVAHCLRARKLCAYTITVKLRFNDLHYQSRSMTLRNPVNTTHDIYKHALALLYAMNPLINDYTQDMTTLRTNTSQPPQRLLSPVRLAGVSVSNLRAQNTTSTQPSLDDIIEEAQRETRPNGNNKLSAINERNKTERIRSAEQALDKVREKYGSSIARIGFLQSSLQSNYPQHNKSNHTINK